MVGALMSDKDLLHDLCNHINQEWNEEIDRVTEAICNRFDMMEAEYGQGRKEQGSGVRAGGCEINFRILARCKTKP
jgi:hypothetical protein